jgi:hypothetical protein
MLETKLYLIWLSCKNFESLKVSKNVILLEKAWNHVKSEMESYFRGYSFDFQSVIEKFKKIRLTTDPNMIAAYIPEIDTLIFNLWALFFSPVKDGFCIPTYPLKNCETLIHEFDHYSFFKEHDMISKTEIEYEEFDKTYENQREKRAFLSERNFLEKYREKTFPHMTSYRIKVTKWTEKGRPLDCWIQPFAITRGLTLEIIDAMIEDCVNAISRIDARERYDEMAVKSSRESYWRMINLLSLPIKLDTKQEYPFIEIKA